MFMTKWLSCAYHKVNIIIYLSDFETLSLPLMQKLNVSNFQAWIKYGVSEDELYIWTEKLRKVRDL